MIIAFAGQKGGSGKSTVAISTAVEWHARGKRVLLVDADTQGSVRAWGERAAAQEQGAPTVVGMGAGMHRPDQLPALAQFYDVVLIDCPPRLDEVQRAAFLIADVAVLPCAPSAIETWALPETVQYIEKAQVIRPSLQAVILITRKVPRTSLAKQARKELSRYGVPVLKTELCHRIAYQQAPEAGAGITQYSPTSAAAAEMRSLVGELERLAKQRARAAA
ncbi:MAG: ParA family partition ATPase [Polyangiales bacterium]